MKLNKKIVVGSIAGVLALSPVLPVALSSSSIVAAATTTSMKLNHNAYVYNAQGKRTYYGGKKTLKMGATVNGSSKTTTINGKSYYPLTDGAYIKAANVGMVGDKVQNGNLELNYNSFVYDENGNRLAKFRGSKKNTHIRKGTPLKYTGSVTKTDRNSKQYFVLDEDNYNQSWLPYKKINGKYYYQISGGGYVNAANVEQIDNKPLYTAEATVAIKDDHMTKAISVGIGKDQMQVKPNQKVKIDRVSVQLGDPANYPVYRISGTKTGFLGQTLVKKQPRQRLLTYTKNTYVQITSDTNTYDMNGNVRSNQFVSNNATMPFTKGMKVPVDELVYIWSNKDNKADLYYHIARSTGIAIPEISRNNKENMTFVKATDGQYLSGPALKPSNTAEEAKADAKVATKADKQELQKQIAQEATVKADKNYNHQRLYETALTTAKEINNSNTASVAAVKQITQVLQQEQKIALLPNAEYTFYSRQENTMPE